MIGRLLREQVPHNSSKMHPDNNFLESSIKLFRYYKGLAEKAIDQLTDEQVLQKPNEASNSIALIVHHLSGNMISRFTDFLTTDGQTHACLELKLRLMNFTDRLNKELQTHACLKL